MAQADWRPGAVQYRMCVIEPAPTRPLEALVRAALDGAVDGGKRRDHYKARIQAGAAEIDGAEHALANHIRDTAEMADPGPLSFVFGDLCTFRPGLAQTLLQEGDDTRELGVGVMEAPNRSHFMGKSVHWLVVDNHVLLLQGQGTRRDTLEKYLKWLLVQDGLLPPETQVALVPGVRLSADVAESTKVTEIKIGSPRPDAPAEAPALRVAVHEQQVAMPAGEQRGDQNWLERLMEVFTGSAEGVEELIREFGGPGDIRAQLILKFTKRRAVVLPSLLTAQAALRNLDDDEVSYKTTAGMKRGEELRLSHPVRVRVTQTNVLDQDDVLRALTEAFRYFVNNGFIANG